MTIDGASADAPSTRTSARQLGGNRRRGWHRMGAGVRASPDEASRPAQPRVTASLGSRCVSSPASSAWGPVQGQAVAFFVCGSASPPGWGHREGGCLFRFYSPVPQAPPGARPTLGCWRKGPGSFCPVSQRNFSSQKPIPGSRWRAGRGEGRARRAAVVGQGGGDPSTEGVLFRQLLSTPENAPCGASRQGASLCGRGAVWTFLREGSSGRDGPREAPGRLLSAMPLGGPDPAPPCPGHRPPGCC